MLGASTSAYAAAMQFVLLTLARRDEVASALAGCGRQDEAMAPARDEERPGAHRAIVEAGVALLRMRMPAAPDPDAFVLVSREECDGGTPLTNRDRATNSVMDAKEALASVSSPSTCSSLPSTTPRLSPPSWRNAVAACGATYVLFEELRTNARFVVGEEWAHLLQSIIASDIRPP
jgi:hypothetical protein